MTERTKWLLRGVLVALAAFALGWAAELPGEDPGPDPDPTTTTTTSSTTTTTTPPGEVKPTAASTGPTTPESDLERVTAAQLEGRMRPGAVIEHVYVTGGDVDVAAADVTLRDFVIEGGRYGIRSCGSPADTDCSTRNWPGGFVAEDGIMRGQSSSGLWGGGVTFRRVEVYDSGGDAFKPLDDVTIEASYGHDLGKTPGAHADFVQMQGDADNVVIRGSNCAMGISTLTGGAEANACLQVNKEVPRLDILVESSWFSGGNYTVNCSGPSAPSVVIADTEFTHDVRYGIRTGCSTGNNGGVPNWRNNRYTDGSPAS